jgi:hypothetical protein
MTGFAPAREIKGSNEKSLTLEQKYRSAQNLTELFKILRGVSQVIDSQNKPLNPDLVINIIQELYDSILESQRNNTHFNKEQFQNELERITRKNGLREAVERILSPLLTSDNRSKSPESIPANKQNNELRETKEVISALQKRLDAAETEEDFLSAISESKFSQNFQGKVFNFDTLRKYFGSKVPFLIDELPTDHGIRDNFYRLLYKRDIQSATSLKALESKLFYFSENAPVSPRTKDKIKEYFNRRKIELA